MFSYAEPVANNRRFQKSAYSDYAPIPTAIKQRNTFYRKVFFFHYFFA